jgi:phosphate transport system substrate-binding protein
MTRLKVRTLALWLAVAMVLGEMAMAQDAVKLDPGLPSYKAVSGVSGNLSSVGSDTLNNLMTLWAEAFSKF